MKQLKNIFIFASMTVFLPGCVGMSNNALLDAFNANSANGITHQLKNRDKINPYKSHDKKLNTTYIAKKGATLFSTQMKYIGKKYTYKSKNSFQLINSDTNKILTKIKKGATFVASDKTALINQKEYRVICLYYCDEGTNRKIVGIINNNKLDDTVYVKMGNVISTGHEAQSLAYKSNRVVSFSLNVKKEERFESKDIVRSIIYAGNDGDKIKTSMLIRNDYNGQHKVLGNSIVKIGQKASCGKGCYFKILSKPSEYSVTYKIYNK